MPSAPLATLCCALCLALGLPLQLQAQQRESILCVGDEQLEDSLKDLKRLAAPVLARRGIAFADRSKGRLTAAELAEDLEREVLKKAPTRVLLSIGSNDFWDSRRDRAVDASDPAAVLASIDGILLRLQEAGIATVVATPLAGPADSARRASMVQLAADLRRLADQRGAICVDAFALSAVEGAYDRRGRLEREAAAALVRALQGALRLNATDLPPLQAHDRVVWFTDERVLDKTAAEVETAFEAARPGIDLVFVNKSMKAVLDDPSFIANQRPKVLLLNYGQAEQRDGSAPAVFAQELRQLLDLVAALPEPPVQVMLVTPVPLNPPDDRGAWQSEGAAAATSAALAEVVQTVGAEAGLPVLDLYATCVALHRAQPDLAFLIKAASGNFYQAQSGYRLALNSLLEEAWGLKPQR